MKKHNLSFLITLIFHLIVFDCYSKYLGGEITYKNVGQDSFLVTLNLYRNCNDTNFGNVTINAYCGVTNQLLASHAVSHSSTTDITPLCPNQDSRCQLSTSNFPYGIEKVEYITLFKLDTTNCCEILFVFKDCCRQSNLTNGLASTSVYLKSMVNKCIAPDNNSPEFKSSPQYLLCIGQDAVFNNGAVDFDINTQGGLSDSLVTEMTPPLGANGAILNYTGSYSYDKPIFFWGFPNASLPSPRGLNIDQYTGDISFRPMKIERTTMAIKVSEYRNGQKIGEVTRECQITIISCPNNQPPLISGPFYKEVCEGAQVTFNFRTMDYDPNDTIFISWDSSIVGASWNDNNGSNKHPTGTFTWTPPPGSASNIPYIFHVTANDGACPLSGRSVKQYQIFVKEIPKIDVDITQLSCNDFEFKQKCSSTANWIIEHNFFHNNPVCYQFSDTGYHHFQVIVSNGYCFAVKYDSIHVKNCLTVDLPNETIICMGSSINLNAAIKSSSGISNISWSTGDTNVNLISLNNVQNDTFIKIIVQNDSGCIATDSMFIDVDEFSINPFQLAPVCHGDEAVLFANPTFDAGKSIDSIKWIGINCGCIKGTSDTFKTYYQATFAVVATNNNGCQAVDTVTTIVHPLPQLTTTFPENLCNDNSFILLDSFFEPSGGKWILKGFPNYIQIFLDTKQLDTGHYTLTYEYTDSNYCFNEINTDFTIHPLPQVSVIDDNVCTKTGDYLLSGQPGGGNWYGNIVSKSGSSYIVNTDSVTVNNAADYYLDYIFTDSNNCSEMNTMRLTLIETKDISISQTSGCEGDTILLSATPAGGIWSGIGVNGNYLYSNTTGTGNQFVYYSFDNSGCSSLDSGIVRINRNPSGNIYLIGDTILVTSGYDVYQWFRNDTLLTGENNFFIIPTLSGDYHCLIGNQAGCLTKTSEKVFSSIDHLDDHQLTIYPNPVTNDEILIDVSRLQSEGFDLFIMDNLGKLIYSENISNPENPVRRKIEFPTAGNYMVVIISGENKFYKKVVVK